MIQKMPRKIKIASLITIIVESIKLLLICFDVFSLKGYYFIGYLIFFIVAVSSSVFLIIKKDLNVDNNLEFLILDISNFIFLVSNIISFLIILSEKSYRQKYEKIFKALILILKKDYPKSKDEKGLNKIFYFILFVWIILCFYFNWPDPTFWFFNKFTYWFYVMIFLVSVSIFIKHLFNNFKDFKKNFKEYIKLSLTVTFILFFITGILLFLIFIIVGDLPLNEIALRQEKEIIIIITSLLYAPIAEEIIFRGILRKLIKNNLAFILISGISFGLFHVVGYKQNLIQYIYIFPYSLMGVGLSYLYIKTNNMFSSITSHFLFNFLAIIKLMFI